MPTTATPKDPVKLLDLGGLYQRHKAEFTEALNRVLDRTAYIGGEESAAFERDFSKFVGEGTHTVGSANGTDAITVGALALKLERGTEAIVPAMTYFATVEALIHAGFTVRLVDVDPKTCLIDLEELRSAINPKTRLIVPVHLYGQMPAMDEIAAIAKKNGCKILEDAAQAQGAQWKGKPVGYWGHVASYSFYPGKNLGAWGDAGGITSRDKDLIEFCRAYGNHGGIKKYEHNLVGINSRLDNLHAAILAVKIKYLEGWNETRRRVAALYRAGLSDLAQVQLYECDPNAKHVYHMFVVRVPDREALMTHLKSRGIETGIHYPKAIHQLPAVENFFAGESYPNAEYAAAHGVSLPMCPTLTEEKAQRVVDAVRAFYKPAVRRQETGTDAELHP